VNAAPIKTATAGPITLPHDGRGSSENARGVIAKPFIPTIRAKHRICRLLDTYCKVSLLDLDFVQPFDLQLRRRPLEALRFVSDLCSRGYVPDAPFLLAWLTGNNEFADLAICCCGHDILGLQLQLVGVGSPVDDLLGINIAYAREGLELIFGR
jgi:hypothetical protein